MDSLKDLGSSAEAALQIVYGIRGEQDLTQEDVAGYRGSRPVRLGNSAFRQRRHDSLRYHVLAGHRLREARPHAGGGGDHLERIARPLRLLSEEADPRTNALLGNTPLLFSSVRRSVSRVFQLVSSCWEQG